MSPRGALGLSLIALLTGCPSKPSPGETSTKGAPTSHEAPKKGLTVLLAGPRPAVRDATFVQPEKSGVSIVARAMVSKVTPADGLRLAMRFVADAAILPSIQWPLSNARVKVMRPDRSIRTLEVAPLAQEQRIATWRPAELAIDGRGLTVYELIPWKAPDPELLSKPGRYTVRLEGKLESSAGPIDFTTPEVPFEVEAASPALVPLADVDASATAAVAKALGAQTTGGRPHTIVDDVGGGRWVRASLDVGRGYDVTIVDSLVSPAGAVVAMQEFHHFTCVARGTVVATPRGEVAIESLAPGDPVWGWDVDRGTRVETPVVSIHESARERLVALGGARLTAEHPVWADGRWTPAADVAPGARLLTFPAGDRAVAEPAIVTGNTAVFDLSVGWPHTFFAGGVLVHNKAVPTELAPGDPWKGMFLRTTDVPLAVLFQMGREHHPTGAPSAYASTPIGVPSRTIDASLATRSSFDDALSSLLVRRRRMHEQ